MFKTIFTVTALLFAFPLPLLAQAGGETKAPITFKMHRVDSYRTETCGVGDFNNDGKLDIVATNYLYLAPDWTKVKIRSVKGKVDDKGKGYWWDFMNAPLDVDGDGLLDVVACSWHGKQSEWYRNPGRFTDGDWAMQVIEKNGNYECGDLWDIDGDGKANEVLPHTQQTVWYEAGKDADGKHGPLIHLVSDQKMAYGGGVGDVNGDGRPDIVRPNGWFEAPADPRTGKWKLHPLNLASENGKRPGHTPQICVYDVNADGRADLITSIAHKHGIYWYEQQERDGKITWKQHVIDKSWSQPHSITLADLDGDGDLDMVTGKRFMAHNGGDPGAHDELVVYWYELQRGPAPKWIRHTLSRGEGVGSGMNVPVVDMDNDGDLDVVTCSKAGGPVWFENKLK